MSDRSQLFKRKIKIRYLSAFRNTAWVVYGGMLLWVIFELETSPLTWILAILVVVISEATLVDFDLAIEMEKEELKEEYGENLNWL